MRKGGKMKRLLFLLLVAPAFVVMAALFIFGGRY